eukprot:3084035-Prymnesium_polylepis.2
MGVVIKYAGNILKGFAMGLAILTTCFLSMCISDYRPTKLFWMGLAAVCVSIVMYSAPPLNDCCMPRFRGYESALGGKRTRRPYRIARTSEMRCSMTSENSCEHESAGVDESYSALSCLPDSESQVGHARHSHMHSLILFLVRPDS